MLSRTVRLLFLSVTAVAMVLSSWVKFLGGIHPLWDEGGVQGWTEPASETELGL